MGSLEKSRLHLEESDSESSLSAEREDRLGLLREKQRQKTVFKQACRTLRLASVKAKPEIHRQKGMMKALTEEGSRLLEEVSPYLSSSPKEEQAKTEVEKNIRVFDEQVKAKEELLFRLRVLHNDIRAVDKEIKVCTKQLGVKNKRPDNGLNASSRRRPDHAYITIQRLSQQYSEAMQEVKTLRDQVARLETTHLSQMKRLRHLREDVKRLRHQTLQTTTENHNLLHNVEKYRKIRRTLTEEFASTQESWKDDIFVVVNRTRILEVDNAHLSLTNRKLPQPNREPWRKMLERREAAKLEECRAQLSTIKAAFTKEANRPLPGLVTQRSPPMETLRPPPISRRRFSVAPTIYGRTRHGSLISRRSSPIQRRPIDLRLVACSSNPEITIRKDKPAVKDDKDVTDLLMALQNRLATKDALRHTVEDAKDRAIQLQMEKSRLQEKVAAARERLANRSRPSSRQQKLMEVLERTRNEAEREEKKLAEVQEEIRAYCRAVQGLLMNLKVPQPELNKLYAGSSEVKDHNILRCMGHVEKMLIALEERERLTEFLQLTKIDPEDYYTDRLPPRESVGDSTHVELQLPELQMSDEEEDST